jgi:hypothetical protein
MTISSILLLIEMNRETDTEVYEGKQIVQIKSILHLIKRREQAEHFIICNRYLIRQKSPTLITHEKGGNETSI